MTEFQRQHIGLQLEEIPEEFGRIILRTLAKRPDHRYQSAADLIADLKQVGSEHGVAT